MLNWFEKNAVTKIIETSLKINPDEKTEGPGKPPGFFVVIQKVKMYFWSLNFWKTE
jgi:hypothetical protein